MKSSRSDEDRIFFATCQTTCHTVEGEGGHSKPALGESWKSIPHMRVLTERDFATGVCTATLTKHTNKVREDKIIVDRFGTYVGTNVLIGNIIS